MPRPEQNLRMEETINEVAANIRYNPDLSICKRVIALNVTKSIIEQILKCDLKFYPYKIRIVQTVTENNNNL